MRAARKPRQRQQPPRPMERAHALLNGLLHLVLLVRAGRGRGHGAQERAPRRSGHGAKGSALLLLLLLLLLLVVCV